MKQITFEIPAGTAEAHCRSCGALIYWITTPKGKQMPLETINDGTRSPTAERAGAGESHHAFCPDARRWRRT